MFTIGIPGFFLTFQPNKDIIKGHFLTNVVLKALPAGLTDVLCSWGTGCVWAGIRSWSNGYFDSSNHAACGCWIYDIVPDLSAFESSAQNCVD
ncbi:MAG: hypothetical protein V8S14_03310 [Lachnospiraceae bacterium]